MVTFNGFSCIEFDQMLDILQKRSHYFLFKSSATAAVAFIFVLPCAWLIPAVASKRRPSQSSPFVSSTSTSSLSSSRIGAIKYQQMANKKSNVEIHFFNIRYLDKEAGNSDIRFYINEFSIEFNGYEKPGGLFVYLIRYFWP